MRSNWNRISLVLLLIVAALGFFPKTLPAETPLRVAVLPFQINAPPELSYLKHGIADMLASRLTWEGKVVVLRAQDPGKDSEKGPVSESAAREIAASLQADLVCFGSLTALGKTFSIDVKLIDAAGKKSARTFFTQSPTLDEVIPKIDLLAADINEQAFGRTLAKKEPALPPAAQKPADPSRMHPEKLIQGGFQDTGAAGQTDIFGTPGGLSPASATFWKSPNYDFLINGLCLADVDGDGKAETVVVTPNEVRIYSKQGPRFSEMAKIDLGRFIYAVGVDAADINGNGIAEIFISATNVQKNAAQSVVLEFAGGKYIPLLENSPWFYRVVHKSPQNPALLGQRISLSDPFSGSVVELEWKGGRYEAGRTVSNKARGNLMGYALGDVKNNGERLPLAYDRFDHIQILGKAGEVLWKGSDKLGGSTLYFTLPKEEPGTENIRYLPMRLVAHDINKQGKTVVVAAKNHELVGGVLERFRVYTKGQFQFLSWDGLGLSTVQETRTFSGFVRDFFIGDFDADGKEELVAAVVTKEGSIAFTEPKSAVIAYEITGMTKR